MNTKNSKRKISTATDTRVLKGGTNIFKSLGRPDAEEAFAKVQLAYQIQMLIEQRRLSQTSAAKLLNTDRARVSNLMRGRLKEFSIERLFDFLNCLDQDVEVRIRPKRHSLARLNVLAKAG